MKYILSMIIKNFILIHIYYIIYIYSYIIYIVPSLIIDFSNIRAIQFPNKIN